MRVFDADSAPGAAPGGGAIPITVLKFFTDVYSCQSTANLLYSNDAKVLVDIILRQLTDLSPHNKVLMLFFSKVFLILDTKIEIEMKCRFTVPSLTLHMLLHNIK